MKQFIQKKPNKTKNDCWAILWAVPPIMFEEFNCHISEKKTEWSKFNSEIF